MISILQSFTAASLGSKVGCMHERMLESMHSLDTALPFGSSLLIYALAHSYSSKLIIFFSRGLS